MKISYCSDLHLEFHNYYIENNNSSDVLIIAGDICPVIEKSIWIEFLDNIQEQYCKCFIVLGNHEFYHTSIDTGLIELLEITSNYSNITVLNNNYEIYNDVGFYGTTLWTNLNNSNPTDIILASIHMNDYRYIKDFSAYKSIELYEKSLEWLKNIKFECDQNIMISHHGPNSVCVDQKYISSSLNSAYYSNIDIDILNKFDFWISGHSHSILNYRINNTKLLRNPRGYPRECPWFEMKYFEI